MTDSPRRGWWTRVVVVVALVLLVATFYLSGLGDVLTWHSIKANLTDLQTRTNADLLPAITLFILAYVAITGLSLPVSVWLAFLAGALFGRWLGFAVASLSATLGATLAMLTSRYVLRDWVQRRFGHRLAVLNRGLERDGAYYLLTLRLLLVVPYWLVNIGMGVSPIRTRTFVLTSWLGMMPATFLYVNAGTELAAIESPRDVLSANVVGAFLLLACVPLVIKFLVRRIRPVPA